MTDEPVRRPRKKSWADLFDTDDKDEGQGYLAQFAEQSEKRCETWPGRRDPAAENDMMFILLSEASSEPHFIKDLSLKYIYVNRAMERLLNRPQREIVGLRDEQLFSHEEAANMASAARRALKEQIVHEEFVRRIDGLPRTFIETLVPWKDRSGNVIAVFGTSVDITDHPDFLPRLNMGDSKSRSAAMQQAFSRALIVARVDSTVLLSGESGCGKDVMARFIHEHSSRAGRAYKAVNCAALPETLVESELFGHEKGAFTGAAERRRGLIEQAHEGTLFLNEIAELPLPQQSKLLSFLDTKRITRVGGEKELQVDVRLLVATHKDLEEEEAKGAFRFDLLHRLKVFVIHIPPLRERKEDLPELAQSLLNKIAEDLKLKSPMRITPSLVAALASYDWPGNVRELRNVLERAVIVADAAGVPLRPDFLDLPKREDRDSGTGGKGDDLEKHLPSAASSDHDSEKSRYKRPKKPSDDELRRLYEVYIEGQGWTRADLAHELGVDDSTVRHWFKAAGLPAGKKGRPTTKAAADSESSPQPAQGNAQKKKPSL